MSRESLELTGGWRFQPDPFHQGVDLGYAHVECADQQWVKTSVPHSFDQCLPILATYEGAAWYRCTFDVPTAWRERRLLLKFEGANYRTTVYVNGQLVGANQDGFLPFEFAINTALVPGARQTLAVCVDSTRHAGDVPGMKRGWRTFGGLLREVTLYTTAPVYLSDVHVAAAPAGEGGIFTLTALAANEQETPVTAELRVSVFTAEGKLVGECRADDIKLAPGATATATTVGTPAQVTAWTPEHPTLYRFVSELVVEGAMIDRRELRTGFRSVAIENGRLLLNGKPLYLTGFNRHEDSPTAGMCTDLATARMDLLDMQSMGANFVRLCHYPHHPGELALCDEIGLLVMCEIPLYWWAGVKDGKDTSKQTLEAAKRQLSRLILRDRNHPSVICWSVSNETEEDKKDVVAGNGELVRLAQALDPTRPATHVSSTWPTAPHFAEDDFISLNGYPTWAEHWGNGERTEPYDLAESTRWWVEQLEKIHALYPDKPILITEFGSIALAGVNGNWSGEDLQAQILEADHRGMSAPYVCGTVIWCYADHPWPEENFVRYLTTSPFGIVTRSRHAKKAYAMAQELFARGRAGAVAASEKD